MKEFRLFVGGLAFVIALLATVLMYLLGEDPTGSIWIIFLVIFFVSLLFLMVALQVLVVRDLKKIEKVAKQLDQDSGFDLPDSNKYNFQKTYQLDQTLRDLANQKSAEITELRKMADFRKDFIANISHELKTPLFAAQGFVHTLLDGAVKDKSVRTRFLKKAAKSLDGLDMLVRDLLTLSQIEIGEIKMDKEYFDIRQLVVEVFDQLEENAQKRNVKLRLSPEKGRFPVFADYHRIHQVITNLIQNGIKYNKDGGYVKVSVKEYKKSTSISVTDNGEGIAPVHLNRIFERFYRVDQSRTRGKGGTGLGLAIVKHIMEGHNSEITVDSKVGRGTKFRFRLPIVKEETIEDLTLFNETY